MVLLGIFVSGFVLLPGLSGAPVSDGSLKGAFFLLSGSRPPPLRHGGDLLVDGAFLVSAALTKRCVLVEAGWFSSPEVVELL